MDKAISVSTRVQMRYLKTSDWERHDMAADHSATIPVHSSGSHAEAPPEPRRFVRPQVASVKIVRGKPQRFALYCR